MISLDKFKFFLTFFNITFCFNLIKLIVHNSTVEVQRNQSQVTFLQFELLIHCDTLATPS